MLVQIETALKDHNCKAEIKQVKHLCHTNLQGDSCTFRPSGAYMTVLHINRSLVGAREFLSYASNKLEYIGSYGLMSYYRIKGVE